MSNVSNLKGLTKNSSEHYHTKLQKNDNFSLFLELKFYRIDLVALPQFRADQSSAVYMGVCLLYLGGVDNIKVNSAYERPS